MRFYNQENLLLPLDMILAENGYSYKKEKCSRNHLTMKNENDDLIVITRASNGHYLYFNPIDDKDKGNIYSFCKNRGIKLNDLLDTDKSLEIKDLKHNINPSSLNNKAIEALNHYKELKDLNFDKPNFFGTKRYIDELSLKPFTKLKIDNFHNLCVPSFVLDEYKGSNIYDFNEKIQFINQCGFMKYLQYPIKKEDGALKQLCYGKKGLEVLKSSEIRRENIENIIVCESIIDTLSLYELDEHKSENTLLCSTNGQVSPNHFAVLEFLAKSSKATLILGFDNDKKGKDFTLKTQQALKAHKIIIKTPCLKDFNDDLIAHKILGLNKHFDKSELENQLNLVKEQMSYFLDKKAVLLSDSLKVAFNRALRAKEIINFLAPKCENFISKTTQKALLNTLTRMETFEQNDLKRGKIR